MLAKFICIIPKCAGSAVDKQQTCLKGFCEHFLQEHLLHGNDRELHVVFVWERKPSGLNYNSAKVLSSEFGSVSSEKAEESG